MPMFLVHVKSGNSLESSKKRAILYFMIGNNNRNPLWIRMAGTQVEQDIMLSAGDMHRGVVLRGCSESTVPQFLYLEKLSCRGIWEIRKSQQRAQHPIGFQEKAARKRAVAPGQGHLWVIHWQVNLVSTFPPQRPFHHPLSTK
jgi:hypothetical protein